jgi:YihY family inner membrane protein
MQINKVIDGVDKFQQRHPAIALPYAIIKKYGDDDGGYQAALITYYGFLSIFPLMLVLLTLAQIMFHNDAVVKQEVAEGIGHFFPLLGQQLQENVHSLHGAGVGLVVGIILTLYGARGAADAFRHALNDIWQVPRMRRAGFPKNLLSSLIIMLAIGTGFIATAAVSSFSAALGHAVWIKIAVNIIGFLVVLAVFIFVGRTATSRKVPIKDMLVGSTFAAVIIQLLLTFGSITVAHQFKNFDNLYGTFAVVLGMLFWIYLLAQVIVYAAEIDSVRHLKLWPRAIQNDKPTDADLHAYELYAHVDRYIPKEEIDVRFKH